jgi:hypothetical protein
MENVSEQAEAFEQADASALPVGNARAAAGSVAPPPHRDWVMPLLSGAVFATIGAVMGRVLGKKGDNADRKLAQSFLPWVMGISFGLVASYSAYESQPKVKKIALRSIEPVVRDASPYVGAGESIAMATPPAGKPLPPQPSIQTEGAQRDGVLDKQAAQQLA